MHGVVIPAYMLKDHANKGKEKEWMGWAMKYDGRVVVGGGNRDKQVLWSLGNSS